METFKRILSVALSVIMIVSTMITGIDGIKGLFAVKANGAYTETLKENADGSFRILQFSDIQDNSYLSAKAFATIRLAVRKYNPNLIVLTGDNILHCNGDDVFRTTVDSFVDEFKDASGNKIPFAVTFGNHDYEVNYHDAEKTQKISLKDQYKYYLSKGAINLTQNGLDTSSVSSATSDNSATLWGTGYIDVLTNDGSKVARRVILLNTGSYDEDNRSYFGRVGYNVETQREESYAKVVSAANSWTNATNSAGEKIKCIVYQHIPLQEVYLGDSPETSILTKPTVTGSITHACYTYINNDTITVNPDGEGRRQYVVSTKNPTMTGTFVEAPQSSYNSTKDLFIALAKENVIGLFYGHDHANTVSAQTKITYSGVQYTLTQGFGGGIDVYDGNYDGIDPQGSCYVIDKDGDLIKEAFSYTSLLTEDVTYPSGDENIKYIKEAALFNGSSFDDACDKAQKAGYIPVTRAFSEIKNAADLNSNERRTSKFVGNGNQFECIAFKQTTNPAEAITDLRIYVTTDSAYSRNNQTKTYTLNQKESEYRIVSGCDGNVNYGVTSNTSCAFLYYTKDRNAGSPLTDIIVEIEESSSTNAYRTIDHRGLQIGDFVETFGTNAVSSFSKVRIANFNLGATTDTVAGDSVYLFQKRYDGCSGYNTKLPDKIITGVADAQDENVKTFIDNCGGYIYGICQPNENFDVLSDTGFNWVRFDVPCPFDNNGYNNGNIK
ncbi:MAG: metallophosphoesterase, partial [Ruminococcus sp.]|nr:metallophosphoesterase [Candidatus Copronaster equi]